MKLPFKRNMGKLDRVVRSCLGITFLVTGLFFLTTTTGIILLILSIPLLGSGITGFCPTYVVLDISTLPRTEETKT